MNTLHQKSAALWTEKYRPLILDDIVGNQTKIDSIKDFFNEFKQPTAKKVLLLSGPPGIGKTSLAHAALHQYGYVPIEYNASDIRGSKNIRESLTKMLNYRSIIDMFNNGSSPTGIIMDEIDTLCSGGGDKGGMTEFLTILKEMTVSKVEKEKEGGEGGEGDVGKDDVEDHDDMIVVKKAKGKKVTHFQIKNPIVCTFNDFTDKKKFTELKKYAVEVKMNRPTPTEMKKVLDKVVEEEKLNINDNLVIKMIIGHSGGDIRRMVVILHDIFITYGFQQITPEKLTTLFECFDKKKVDVQLFEATHKIMEEKIPLGEAIGYFDMDKLLLPMMVHENFIRAVDSRKVSIAEKIRVDIEILDLLCDNDIVQTDMFEHQMWELSDYSGVLSTALPNHLLNAMPRSLTSRISLEYTTLFNKMSSYYSNRKFLNTVAQKIGTDLINDELFFLSEIVVYHIYDNEGSKEKGVEILKKHGLSPEDVDTLLRINKFFNEEFKKKYTTKIKKELMDFTD